MRLPSSFQPLLWIAALMPAIPLAAVEYPLPEQPQRADLIDLVPEQPTLVVDWGRVSETRKRDPAECNRQRDAFKSFLTSPEFMAFVQRHGMRTDMLSAIAGQEELDKLRQHLASQPHETRIPRGIQQREGEGPLPVFLEHMGAEQRKSLRLVLYDDADSHQREWLLRWHAEHADDPYLTIVIAQGWTSFGALERFATDHPKVTITPVASDDYARGFGVTSFPAVITFPSETRIHRVEGLIPLAQENTDD